MQQTFPDLSSLFAAKAQRRLTLAALSWEAKVAIIEQMRQLLPKDAWKSRSTKLDTQTRAQRTNEPTN
jgi:hypothetical protein